MAKIITEFRKSNYLYIFFPFIFSASQKAMIINSIKKASETFVSLAYCIIDLRLLYFINDSFERCGIVHCEVGENLTVDLDTSLVQSTHQL